MQAFIKDQSKVSLERTPKNDTVAFKGTQGQQESVDINSSVPAQQKKTGGASDSINIYSGIRSVL